MESDIEPSASRSTTPRGCRPGSMTVFSSVYASTAVRPRVTDASQLGELGLAAGVGVDLCAVDEHADRGAEHVERIARPDDQVGILAWLDGAEPVLDTGDPGRVDRQCAQRGLAV